MPPGRKPVVTRRIADERREEAYAALREHVEEGQQGFVLFPLVEESEKSDRRAAVSAARRLSEGSFRDRTVGLLHGRMPVAERIETIARFRSGEIDVLVSTTVVEVGVDLPGATVMVVEHADRFGLSQLHQIRGRVGRSDLPALCFLLTEGPITEEAERRLSVLEEEHDGFRVAEEDLRLRGPGELLGERQHGPSGMGIADLLADTELLELARREAFAYDGDDAPLPAPLRSG
jgi:ATP-dependent DNA helicase RecG